MVHPVNAKTINQNVLTAEYAVRGPIVVRAGELALQLKKDPSSLPFEDIVLCNIGNPQSLGQKPITFYRQIMAICDYPDLLDSPECSKIFPEDVIARSKEVLANTAGGTGAYTESKGLKYVREQIATFLEKRDGHKADPEMIYTLDGASSGVNYMLTLLIRGKQDAMLVPIPQYPLYSAGLALYGGTLCPYYLKEENNWGLDVNEMRKEVQKAKKDGVEVRALVVINPGNPTGNSLSLENQQEVVKFCAEENLILLSDEVYQDNIYVEGKSFVSMKKVVADMGYGDKVALASLQSTSKGFYGECGKRGGFMELYGAWDQGVLDQLLKLASINLCPNVSGQILIGQVCTPPVEGDASYALYEKEKADILASLKRRSGKLVDGLNKLTGVTCNNSDGAMYAFPNLTFPEKFLKDCEGKGKMADAVYCMSILEETGIVVVPGSGFGQADGTWHFRTTFLPGEDKIDAVVERLSAFHENFMKKWM
jgi:alanine transaminase